MQLIIDFRAFVGCCFIFTIIAIMIVLPDIPSFGEYVSSFVWSKTMGIIAEHDVFKVTDYNSRFNNDSKYIRTWYSPRFIYSFQIENETYTSKRTEFASFRGKPITKFDTQKEAEDYLQQHFPINKEIDVYYNYFNPQQSVLYRRYSYNWEAYKPDYCFAIVTILLLSFAYDLSRKFF